MDKIFIQNPNFNVVHIYTWQYRHGNVEIWQNRTGTLEMLYAGFVHSSTLSFLISSLQLLCFFCDFIEIGGEPRNATGCLNNCLHLHFSLYSYLHLHLHLDLPECLDIALSRPDWKGSQFLGCHSVGFCVFSTRTCDNTLSRDPTICFELQEHCPHWANCLRK